MENTIKVSLDGISRELEKQLNEGRTIGCFRIDNNDVDKKKANAIEMAEWLIKTVKREEIISFALPGELAKSHDKICESFVDLFWDDLPSFTKSDDYYPSKECLLEHCKDTKSEKNLLRYVMTAFQAVLQGLIKKDQVVKHVFFVWGLTGSGKTTLIITIASALNAINPDNEALRQLKIDANEVGTKEVSDPIEFCVGAMQLSVNDVPGTEDYSEDRSHSKLIKEVKGTKNKVDSVLYTQNIGEQCRPNQTKGEKATLYSLADAFKSEGLKFWERVIVCLTKANKFTPETQKPKYRNDFDDEELSQYIDDYNEYMKAHVKGLEERIKKSKEKFKENWKELFDKKVYENISDQEKDIVFNKIRFVVCGTVEKNNKYKNEPNPFMRSTILSIPDFDIIPNLANINEENQEKINKVNNEINSGKYVKYNNWVNELYNKIIESSSLDFQINCTNASYEGLKMEEDGKNDQAKREQEGRRPNTGDVRISEETAKKMAKGISNAIKTEDKTNSVIEYTCTGLGVLGGGAAAVAAAAAWMFVLGGAVLGAGGGFATGRGITSVKDYFLKKK